jgi:hypothetical protein
MALVDVAKQAGDALGLSPLVEPPLAQGKGPLGTGNPPNDRRSQPPAARHGLDRAAQLVWPTLLGNCFELESRGHGKAPISPQF